jgi:uncharacterized membrane protein
MDAPRADHRRSLGYALLIGIGVMAGVDEIIFHQLLQWHHFYDGSTPFWGIFSDGLLHAAELLAVVAGFFLLADLARRGALSPRWAWAGFFLGAGGFQVFDGGDVAELLLAVALFTLWYRSDGRRYRFLHPTETR